MRVGYDIAVLSLTVDMGQIADGNDAARYDVRKHVARSDRRQLILVADHYQPAAVLYRLDQRVKDVFVAHTDLVYDNDVLLEFRIFVIAETSLAVRKIQIEKSVYSLCLEPRSLGKPFCRSARRCAQTYRIIPCAEYLNNAPYDRSFTRAGTARYHVHAAVQTAPYRGALTFVQSEFMQLFVLFEILLNVERN